MPWIDYQLEAHVTFGKKRNLGTSFCYQNKFQLVQRLKCKQNEFIVLEGRHISYNFGVGSLSNVTMNLKSHKRKDHIRIKSSHRRKSLP